VEKQELAELNPYVYVHVYLLGYLTSLYQLQRIYSVELYKLVIAFGDIKRIGEEGNVAYFNVPSRHSFVVTEENH
jgi:hypothetical protein